MKNSKLFLSMLIFLPTILLSQIADAQIPASVQKYFERNRLGPTLLSVKIVDDDESGRILKVKIIATRNKSGNDLAFAFAAAAAVANMAELSIDLLWVEMDINFKDLETTMAIAPANCTIDAIILKNTETEKWWQDCLQFP